MFGSFIESTGVHRDCDPRRSTGTLKRMQCYADIERAGDNLGFQEALAPRPIEFKGQPLMKNTSLLFQATGSSVFRQVTPTLTNSSFESPMKY